MTDRYNALTVVLEHDIRADDAQAIADAILMVKGVLSVKPHVTTVSDFVAETRARQELSVKIMAVLRGE